MYYLCKVRRQKVESLKDKNKVLYKVMTHKLLNKGYLARMIYDVKEASSDEAKRATTKFSQKLNGKSSVSNEEMVKMYRVVIDDLIELSESIKSIAQQMEDLDTEITTDSEIMKIIKDNNLTPEQAKRFIATVKKELGK